jgi:predicted permease
MLAFLCGKLLQFDRPVLMAIVLTSAFGNTGNYGLPLVSFAFGQEALAFATLNFVTTSLMFNTVGVLIASLGHMDIRTALTGLFKVPTVYAVILAILLNSFHLILPLPLSRTVDLAANASIPVMIILLGLELSRIQWSHSFRAVGLSTGIRLLAGPAIGLLLALLFGMKGAVRQGNVTEASMPAAVTTIVLATEYGLDPSLVTAMVYIGTLLSPLTLTPLLVYLGK